MQRIERKSMPTGRLLLAGGIIVLAGCVVGGPSFGIAQDKTSSPGLSGTTWQLRTIQSMAEEQPTITVEQPERYTLRFHADGRLTLQLDCNRGIGSWQATPASGDSGQLAFGPIATTRMFCPPPSLDTRVAHDLGLVRSYLLRDDHRLLTLQSDSTISAWQPAPTDDPEKRTHQ